MAETQSLHLRHQVTPEYVGEMLTLLGGGEPVESAGRRLLDLAGEWGLAIGSFRSADGAFADILKVMRKLGLVDGLRLSELGRDLFHLSRQKRQLVPDVLHFLLFSGITAGWRDGVHWGYRQTCVLLWSVGRVDIDRQLLAGQVMDDATQEFGQRPAFSVNSVDAVLNWLRALEPSVIEQEPRLRFHRRGFCSPELVLLGMDHLYRLRGIDYQSNLPLDAEASQYLQILTLVGPESMKRLIQHCVELFEFCSAGSQGFSGDYVLLERPVTLADLAE